MRWIRMSGLSLMLMFLSVIVVVAQDECQAMVQQALKVANDACGSVGRGEVCFGNPTVELVPLPNVRIEGFAMAGDIVPLSAIEEIEVGAYDPDEGTWGVAVMKIQANVPDVITELNVTYLLFGKVVIANTVPEDIEGVSAMQGFHLYPSDESDCDFAPNGILIQTPVDIPVPSGININDLNILFEGTLYVHGFEDEEGAWLLVEALSGRGVVQLEDEVRPLFGGTLLEFELDEELDVFELPVSPVPYDDKALINLPIQNLPEEIIISPAMGEDEIVETIRQFLENNPEDGSNPPGRRQIQLTVINELDVAVTLTGRNQAINFTIEAGETMTFNMPRNIQSSTRVCQVNEVCVEYVQRFTVDTTITIDETFFSDNE